MALMVLLQAKQKPIIQPSRKNQNIIALIVLIVILIVISFNSDLTKPVIKDFYLICSYKIHHS